MPRAGEPAPPLRSGCANIPKFSPPLPPPHPILPFFEKRDGTPRIGPKKGAWSILRCFLFSKCRRFGPSFFFERAAAALFAPVPPQGPTWRPQVAPGGFAASAAAGRPNKTSNQTSGGSLVSWPRQPHFGHFPFHFPFRGEKGSAPRQRPKRGAREAEARRRGRAVFLRPRF